MLITSKYTATASNVDTITLPYVTNKRKHIVNIFIPMKLPYYMFSPENRVSNPQRTSIPFTIQVYCDELSAGKCFRLFERF
jgi:hypothetical protein